MTVRHADRMSMATAAQIDALRTRSPQAAETRVLQHMIRHHQGAVQMAGSRLAASPRPKVARVAPVILDGQLAEITPLCCSSSGSVARPCPSRCPTEYQATRVRAPDAIESVEQTTRMRYRTKLAAGAALVLIACGQAPTGQTDGFGDAANAGHVNSSAHGAAAAQASTAALPVQPVIATSELVVGPNRMALALLENNVPIEDAATTTITVRYFRINGTESVPVGEAEDARFYGEHLGARGTWIAHPTFDTAGKWGLELTITRPNREPLTLRTGIDVAERANAPKIGDQAPTTETPTAADVSDLTTITSDAEPDPRLYALSVADAVTSGTPSLVMFATPGFCGTAVCGPGVDVLSRLKGTFGDGINAVHVEIYQLPYEGTVVQAMNDWNLQSEPWLFLVDTNGTIVGRYEGGITFAELEPAVAALVNQGR